MKTVLVIDDERSFADEVDDASVTYARTSRDGIDALQNVGALDELWLDHDLGGSDTISPVIGWLCEQAFEGTPFPVQLVVVHTANPTGASTMIRSLERFGYRCTRVWADTVGLRNP